MLSEAEKTALDSTAAQDNPGGRQHIVALDGLRGIAILLILYVHFFTSNPNTGNRFFDFFNALRASSWVGVNLFFVLSGFLITGILRSTLHHHNYFKIFYARRSLRIFPLYYGFLFFLLAVSRPLHMEWNGWQYYYLTYTANLAIWRFDTPLPLHYFNINHFWSLCVEEQFYLVWPFVVYRVRSIPKLIQYSLVTCAGVLILRIVLSVLRDRFADPYLTYSFTPSCADNLLFGSCLALALRTPSRQRILDAAPRVFAVCAGILLVLAFVYHGLILPGNAVIPSIGTTIVAITATSLIAMTLVEGSFCERIFENSFLRFFGRYSYGLYVYHYSVEETLSSHLRAWFNLHSGSKAGAIVGTALVNTVVSIAIAMASYHLFEVHFLKLKRFFSYASASKGKTILEA